MKIITTTFALLLFFSTITQAFAETYGYIDINGDLKVVSAESAELAIASAENIAFDSGVMVMSVKGLALINDLGIAIQSTVGAVSYTSVQD